MFCLNFFFPDVGTGWLAKFEFLQLRTRWTEMTTMRHVNWFNQYWQLSFL
jgi:hypothetical protein